MMKSYSCCRHGFVLALVLMLALAVSAHAAARRLSVESKSAKAGESVSVEVSLEGNPGICAFSLSISYDAGKLEYQSYTLGSAFQSGLANPENGVVKVLWDDTADMSRDTSIITLNFRVRQGTSGDTVISAAMTECYNFNDVDVNFEQGRGTVSIISDASQQPMPQQPTTDISANSITFTDENKIKHLEAVKTLAARGVINGFPDGSFSPEGNVSRAQMAKMIVIVKNGNFDQAEYKGRTSELTDVSGHWAEPYINYCVSQGIINGRGNGKFDPDDNVTTAEAAKMLLVAIGVNANGKYIGDQWAINVMSDAWNQGLLDQLIRTGTLFAMNRDDAAQMIYNAIQEM